MTWADHLPLPFLAFPSPPAGLNFVERKDGLLYSTLLSFEPLSPSPAPPPRPSRSTSILLKLTPSPSSPSLPLRLPLPPTAPYNGTRETYTPTPTSRLLLVDSRASSQDGWRSSRQESTGSWFEGFTRRVSTRPRLLLAALKCAEYKPLSPRNVR